MADDMPHLVLVLAADADDYTAWCRTTGRMPLNGSLWALSWATGMQYRERTFQVTDRWRERRPNRNILAGLRRHGVQYGDEHGPWPAERVPDLSWPTVWQRLTRRAA